jgi:hypothetical protein
MISKIRLTLFALVLALAGSLWADELTSTSYRIVSHGTSAGSSVSSGQWMDKGPSQYGSYHIVGKTFPSTPRTASTPFPENSTNPPDLIGTNFGLNQGFLYTLFNFKTASTTRFTDASGNDVTSYEIGTDGVYVTVTDSDENTDSNSAQTVSVIITCATSGDSETVTLTETGNNTGVFRNTTGIPSANPPATQNNGIIEAAGGNIITATYTDNDYSSDTSNDTATMTGGVTAPPAPTLISPVDGSFTNDPTPSFDWSDSTGADTYTLQIDDADDFLTPIIVKTGLTVSNYTLSGTAPEDLSDGQYWWRCFAVNSGGSSPASEVWTLTVDTQSPAAPVITRPVNNWKTNDTTPLFEGTAEPNATLKVYDSEIGLIATMPVQTDGSWSVSTDALDAGSHLAWAVATDRAGNPSGFSDSVTFVIDITPPAAPTGLYAIPGNGYIDLFWDANTETDLAGYRVYRKAPGQEDFVLISGETRLVIGERYRDDAVTNGLQYSYKITARDDAANEAGQ